MLKKVCYGLALILSVMSVTVYARCCPGDCCISDGAKLAWLAQHGMSNLELSKAAEMLALDNQLKLANLSIKRADDSKHKSLRGQLCVKKRN